MTETFDHLPHINDFNELKLYDLIPDVVWVFDIDKHGWWWGNQAAIDFWGLENLDQLIHKDLSGDTQGARDRTLQTFERAQAQGLTIDPWTTYPNGKPKTLYMRHRAALVGPDRHRAIIAYIIEQVDLGETPENLLLVEAMRYTRLLVTSFDFNGEPVTENPAASEAYPQSLLVGQQMPTFVARFADPEQGRQCLHTALDQEGGRWTYEMRTSNGIRKHSLDIRKTRHPLTGDFLLLVVESDVTELHQALDAADKAKQQLQQMAHYDALTELPNLRMFEEKGGLLLAQAQRNQSRFAILFMDLDGFKGVNDRFGHQAGDQLLQKLARRLQAALRHSDLIARIGGDEFVLLQAELTDQLEASTLANKVIEILSAPYDLQGEKVALGVSVGIAIYPDNGDTLEQLLDQADQAMYQVKQQGKNSFGFAR